MKITFSASIEGQGCIKYDADRSAVVKLTVPASEIAEVTKLLAYPETVFRVTMEPQK